MHSSKLARLKLFMWPWENKACRCKVSKCVVQSSVSSQSKIVTVCAALGLCAATVNEGESSSGDQVSTVWVACMV